MRRSLRQTVSHRYEFRCGYCGVHENDIGSELTVDHFQPRTYGGDDDLDNLVYCCHPCNEFKGDYWQTEPDLRLLHPLLDDMSEHIREHEDGTLIALTERGANHIQTLHLNRPRLIAHRLEREIHALSRQLNTVLLERLRESEQKRLALANEVSSLRRTREN